MGEGDPAQPGGVASNGFRPANVDCMIYSRSRAHEPWGDRAGSAALRSSIIVSDIDPGDIAWLEREARKIGMSVEEFLRRLIHEQRTKTERRPKPSEAFARHFGEAQGVELPATARRGYRPVSLL